MKKSNLLRGMLALALVFGMTFAGCKNDDGVGFDPGSKLGDVPGITDLSPTYSSYTAIPANDADGIAAASETVSEEMESLYGDISTAISSSIDSGLFNIQDLSSRATESINQTITIDENGLKGKYTIKGTASVNESTYSGSVNVTVSYDFNVTEDYRSSSNCVVKGNLKGSGSVKASIGALGSNISGTVTSGYSCALIFAFTSGTNQGKYVRCVVNVSVTQNLATEVVKVTGNYWLYGDGNTLLVSKKL